MSGTSNKGQERDRIYCIGIIPWGYVGNSESLVGEKGKGLYPAEYKVNPIVKRKEPVSLDPHHTHFLLVDDGTMMSYGYDIPYRAELENAMTELADEGPTDRVPTDKTKAISVVKICLGGGEDTINSAKIAVEKKTPVVFCEGTGRAANLLAEASKNCVFDELNKVWIIEPSKQKDINGRIASVCQFGDDPKKKEKIKDLEEAISVIMKHKRMITVFSMDGGEQAGLDLAILKAILKGEAAKPESQLELAQSWGRADVAKSIFEGNNEWKPDSFDKFVTKALKKNQVDFLQLFLENGAIMKEYIDTHLTDLYNKEEKVLYRKLLDKLKLPRACDDMSTCCTSGSASDDVQMVSQFEHPFTELFVWAILGSRMDLAEFLWERGENQVCLAIVAYRMISSMSKKEKDSASKFEELALSVIQECFCTNEELAQRMITTPHKLWGGMDTLKIAANSNFKEFISHPCAQAVLDNTWKGGMQCSWWEGVLAWIFPLLLLVITYKTEKLACASICKVWKVYNAPVTKFIGGVMSYMLLLLLFSYVLIFNFQSKPSFWENVLFAWICTLIIEEIRQLKVDPLQWARSYWNWADVFMLILALVGYVLHLSSKKTESAKELFSASCFLFYVRLLRFYAVYERLGLKIVMIRKMIFQLLLFLGILLVFMVGYGVAIQSLLFPNEKDVGEAIVGVLYMPYLQILGELFLDVTIEGNLEDCSSNNTDDNLHLCPKTGPVVSILFVIYLLVGNVLLLNLLIAIFSFVFDEIQSKSEMIWKYERYALVMEYVDKPTLVPPFHVFEIIIKWLYRKHINSCCKQHSTNGLYETDDELKTFEKECAARYLWKKAELQYSEVSEKVDRIEKKLDDLLKTKSNKSEEGNLDVSVKVDRIEKKLDDLLKKGKGKVGGRF
ncbi:transient receptor potential cation channel subfamily M member-like 2 [Anneissia japonica]|uniref:transient receptor potential cation channel subfamily M member-like 2 n=1 Tax=Anneissia japonica TaxID=1529436 RepID=UPI0014255B69|nr:transient receptor potential cation channel subfamily M member-like 2 [Anneissia japonica]